MGYILLFIIGLIGATVFRKLRVPAAALIGAMLFTGIARIMGITLPVLPDLAVDALQLLLGIYIGLKLSREQLKFIKKSFWPTIMVVGWTIGATIITAIAIVNITNLDIATALLGATPGGITEMSVFAFFYGAQVPVVALLQLIRLVLVLVLMPIIVMKIKEKKPYVKREAQAEADNDKADKADRQANVFSSLGVLATGLAVGILFIYLDIPAGGLLGAVIGAAMGCVILNQKVYMSEKIQQFVQLGFGINIGLYFTAETFFQLLQVLPLSLLLGIIIFISGVLQALILRAMTGWDLTTCLLSSAPGGLPQMVILTDETEGDVVKVSYFQIIRLLTIFLILQQVFRWYLSI
ncbi:MAG: AbrB family transcriptional regulator [Bacillota bacterium]|nr:AbrB family transcriptional regulator [Bacillota bacterium]